MILSLSPEIGPDDFAIASSQNMAQSNGDLACMAFIPEAVNLREFLENLEKGLILRALESSDGVQAEAARRLHLSRSDLAYKLAKYEIKPDRE